MSAPNQIATPPAQDLASLVCSARAVLDAAALFLKAQDEEAAAHARCERVSAAVLFLAVGSVNDSRALRLECMRVLESSVRTLRHQLPPANGQGGT